MKWNQIYLITKGSTGHLQRYRPTFEYDKVTFEQTTCDLACWFIFQVSFVDGSRSYRSTFTVTRGESKYSATAEMADCDWSELASRNAKGENLLKWRLSNVSCIGLRCYRQHPTIFSPYSVRFNHFALHLLFLLPPPKKELMFWFGLFVCLSVCPSDYSQTCERILTKFFGGVGHGSRTKWYNFGGDPDHALDPGVQSPKSWSSGSAEVCALWVHFLFLM